jgi:hypothetical protein
VGDADVGGEAVDVAGGAVVDVIRAVVVAGEVEPIGEQVSTLPTANPWMLTGSLAFEVHEYVVLVHRGREQSA